MHTIRKPYLIFLGDVRLKSDAKTGFGLKPGTATAGAWPDELQLPVCDPMRGGVEPLVEGLLG